MGNRRGALLIFIITICSFLITAMALCKPWLSKKEKQQEKANEFYGYNNYQMEYTFAKEDLYPRVSQGPSLRTEPVVKVQGHFRALSDQI